MGFFNFIETSFFVSLAITFILVFLLVYFFKQKLTTLETKYDTMLTIVGNVVKEVNIIRQAIVHTTVLQNMNTQPMINVNTHNSHLHHARQLQPISEEDDNSESDQESESDDYSEDGDREESGKYHNENICFVHTEKCATDPSFELVDICHTQGVLDADGEVSIVESEDDADDDEDAGDDDDTGTVYSRIEEDDDNDDMHIDNSTVELDVEPTITYPSVDIAHELEIPEFEIDDSFLKESVMKSTEEDTVPTYSGPTEILDITYEQDEPEPEQEERVEKSVEEHEDKESYKKMNIHQLKALVVTKGLVSDASKLKKNEIIRILEGTI